MGKLFTALKLLRNPPLFFDTLISRLYWSSTFTRVAFRYCDRRDWRYTRKQKLPAVPPSALRFIICGSVDPRGFWDGGERSVKALENALLSTGRNLTNFHDILDFGCGCGRMLLALHAKLPDAHLSGTDTNRDEVRWCRKYFKWADFRQNAFLPPSTYEDEAFDFIYLNSVFTHIDFDAQHQWLREFKRILKPSAILLITVHGPTFWATLPQPHVEVLQRDGFLCLDCAPGQPDGAFHTPEYIEQHWSKYFDVLRYIPQGAGAQDVVVLSKAGC